MEIFTYLLIFSLLFLNLYNRLRKYFILNLLCKYNFYLSYNKTRNILFHNYLNILEYIDYFVVNGLKKFYNVHSHSKINYISL